MIGKAKTVIIADDEPILRLDLSVMLESAGFTVVGEAADGFDAIELCKKHKPDIALLDVKMPVFDGLSAASEILNNNLAGCVVFLTAYSDNILIEKAGKIGVTGYLVKPVEERLLRPTIEVAYSSRRKITKSLADAENAKQKLESKNYIDRAKAVIAKKQGISESEAYRQIQQTAMDKRITMLEIAKAVLKTENL